MTNRTKDEWLKFEDAVGGPGLLKPAAVVAIVAMASLLLTLALTRGPYISLLVAMAVFIGGTLYELLRLRTLAAAARPIFEENRHMTAQQAVAEARLQLRRSRYRGD